MDLVEKKRIDQFSETFGPVVFVLCLNASRSVFKTLGSI